ncbi:zinc finger protein 28 homolog [Neocloeon triangulifer]|uniref:zinc finger protein 28 homolog n=1 Tax=Neocloeon triangulifer TaxID=2078957 RepID=UPI00286ED3BC|nr:zinc finger protein 28 homolog [Neocloeon triangulifer]
MNSATVSGSYPTTLPPIAHLSNDEISHINPNNTLEGSEYPDDPHYNNQNLLVSVPINTSHGQIATLVTINHFPQLNQEIQMPQMCQVQKGPCFNQQAHMPTLWPTSSALTTGSDVADINNALRPPGSTLPIGLHHLLKYSAPLENATVKKIHQPEKICTNQVKKRKKKRVATKDAIECTKPGEIRVTTALDGTRLFCCPECQMGYHERELLEQHLSGHKLERRFMCDICGAALKRKDHLTRHKQSHNPERPFVCTICSKAFKRKEQLTLHFVIHSGEKRHICPECNKGFYRKDHLRKHTRSHISRRVKAEVSRQLGNNNVP